MNPGRALRRGVVILFAVLAMLIPALPLQAQRHTARIPIARYW